ncbi:MAG: hypothetical protein ABUT39_04445 [Acidobacteriota bacterium]
MTIRLRSVHRKAFRLLVFVWMVVTLVCVLAAWRFWVIAESRIPSLTNGSQLAAALEWPWLDFPPVTEMERQTLQEKASLYEPMFRADLRPWTDIPVDGLLGYPRDHGLRPELEESARAMTELAESWSGSAIASRAWQPDTVQLQQARGLLAQAIRNRPRWIPLYNSALLDLWTDAPMEAIRHLQDAQALVDEYLNNPERLRGLLASEKARIYEAAILTHYAMGHALLEGGNGSQDGPAAQRTLDSVKHFRQATELLTPLLETGVGVYGREGSPLRSFPLESTHLGTGSLWNDLIAAYMSASAYKSCPRPPMRVPECTREFGQGDACAVRDSAVCRSLQRVGPRLQTPFQRLVEATYSPDSRGEHDLWAFMTLIDLMNASPDLGNDSYLLGNSAILFANLGESTLAGEQLAMAEEAAESDSQARLADRSRLQKINFLAKVLHGQPSEESEPTRSEEASLHRQAYYKLYQGQEDLPFQPFRLPRELFSQSERDLVDRWLFIRLWREWLRQGQFDRFLKEYQRSQEANLASDFFRRWRESTLRELGRRALEKAAGNRNRGEQDQADKIVSFVASSGYFPADVVRQARSESGLGGPTSWKLAALLVLLIPQLLLTPFLIGLMRLHRQTFFSSFRVGRKGGFDSAYPS